MFSIFSLAFESMFKTNKVQAYIQTIKLVLKIDTQKTGYCNNIFKSNIQK